MELKKRIKLAWILSFILLGLGIFLSFLDNLKLASITSTTIGIVFLVLILLKYRNIGDEIQVDERTEKISGKALSLSWLISFVTLNFIFWINRLSDLNLSAETIISLMFFTMIVSASIMQYFFKLRGIDK